MATYENPYGGKGRPIRTRNQVIGQGLMRMAQGFAKDKIAQQDREKRDVEEADALLKDRSTKAKANFSKGVNAASNDIAKFTSGFSGETRNVLFDEISNAVDSLGQELSDWMQDNPEASLDQINLKTQQQLMSVKQLQRDVGHLEQARLEYIAARDKLPGEEGALVPGFNPHLIKFFEAQDRNDPGIRIGLEDNGNWRISVVDEEQLGNTLNTMSDDALLEFTSFNLTQQGERAEAGDGYFQKVEKPDYTNLQKQIDSDIEKGNTQFGKKNADGSYSYNHQNVNDYFSAKGDYARVKGEPTVDGKDIITRKALGVDNMSNWIYFGGPDSMNDANNFNEDIFATTYIDNFVQGLPGYQDPTRVSNKPSSKAKPKDAKSLINKYSNKAQPQDKSTYSGANKSQQQTLNEAIKSGYIKPGTTISQITGKDRNKYFIGDGQKKFLQMMKKP